MPRIVVSHFRDPNPQATSVHELAHDDAFVVGNCAEIHVLVGQDRDRAAIHPDQDLSHVAGSIGRPALDLIIIRLFAPRIRASGIHEDRQAAPILLGGEDHVTARGEPMLTDHRLKQVIAIETPANGRTMIVYPASPAYVTMLAPLVVRLTEGPDLWNLATESACAAGSASGDQGVVHTPFSDIDP